MLDADEGDVIQLVVRAVHPAATDRGLVFARQVGELGGADEALVDRPDLRRCIEHLVGRNARERAAEDHARSIAARFAGREPGGLEALEDRGDVLDPDPVELNVLTIGDIGQVAAVSLGCPGDRAELLGAHAATVDPDPHHEELVLELLRLRGAGPFARDILPALRIQAPPSHPAPQILRADRAEPAGSEDALDPLADVERLGLLFYLLGGVEGLMIAERPLPFAPGARGSTGGRIGHGRAREGARYSAAQAATVGWSTAEAPTCAAPPGEPRPVTSAAKYCALISTNGFHSVGVSSSEKMAVTGQTGTHASQSTHSSGWM